jgi:hypothetical protein
MPIREAQNSSKRNFQAIEFQKIQQMPTTSIERVQ